MKRSEDIIINNSIRDYRFKMNLSQSDLASLIGVSKNTVSSWELGTLTPNLVNLFLLCHVFDCSVYDLIQISFM